jgi:hypothetical protein
MHTRCFTFRFQLLFLLVCSLIGGLTILVNNKWVKAQSVSNGLSLQVAPSPLVGSVKPGETKTMELKIRNNSLNTEQLKIELRSFTQNGQNGQIQLGDTQPGDVSSWVTFSAPVFNVQPGEWYNENITVSMPQNAGFSYSFVVLISRQNEVKNTTSQLAVQGSLAVFTLINVDRPDANRQLQLAQFSVEHRLYEYLPAKFSVTLRNSGNTIVQPYGNIFILRSSNSKSSLAVLPLNEAKNYILPNTSRTVSSQWQDGFPVYISDSNGKNRHLVWDWNNISNLRFGKYTAKLVGAYNDGQRDVPLEATITFWVIPWKLLIGVVIVVVILLIGIITIIKKGVQITPRRKTHAQPTDTP